MTLRFETKRRIKGLALLMLLLAGVAVGLRYYDSLPVQVSDSTAYRLGTQGKLTFVPVARIHYMAKDIPTNISGFAISMQMGNYQPRDGSIDIWQYPILAPLTLRSTLEHEYGHAALYAYLHRYALKGDTNATNLLWNNLASDDYLRSDAGSIPSALRPVVDEYLLNRRAFGDYGATNFLEWYAEGQRLWLSGRESEVPPGLLKFLRDYATLPPPPRTAVPGG
jgi:hypothetical protein